MAEIAIYRGEREAGLEARLRASTAVACAGPAQITERFPLPDRVSASLRATAGKADFDLHYLESVLVTTGLNRNDDFFDVVETWSARHSPEDKPFNYEHNDRRIVGHITGGRVVDADMKAVADETVVDDLPAKLHIVTGAVLYKSWQTPELQEQMDTLLAEIAKGAWYVSMEAIFLGFDFVIVSTSGTTRVVARNENTCFLTKHLRAYGGNGTYGNDRVGRVLRRITFSGHGLVRKPANPESVIFQPESTVAHAVAAWFDGRAEAGVIEPVARPATKVANDILKYLSA